MSDMILRSPTLKQQIFELSPEERTQLNAIIDILIPADKEFPPPSSLHLIDELLSYLKPGSSNKSPSIMNIQRLRAILRDLNSSARGSFSEASAEIQHAMLIQLERREPAYFQALWVLASHSYYARLAKLQRS